MHKECCCAAEMLTPENARRQIDHVITEVLYHKKPGYIAIPTDVTALSVEPPAAALVPRLPALSENSVEAFKEAAAAMLNNAKSASLLVGHLVERFNVIPAVNQFVENVNIPYSVGALGKGCVKETLKTYSGIYIPGIIPFPAQDIVEHSDVSITFGVEMTDAVTAGFKQKFPKNTIHVNPFEVVVGEQRFSQVPIAVAIAVLQEICKAAQGKWKFPKNTIHVNPFEVVVGEPLLPGPHRRGHRRPAGDLQGRPGQVEEQVLRARGLQAAGGPQSTTSPTCGARFRPALSPTTSSWRTWVRPVCRPCCCTCRRAAPSTASACTPPSASRSPPPSGASWRPPTAASSALSVTALPR
eukprot:gene7357-biopygen4949